MDKLGKELRGLFFHLAGFGVGFGAGVLIGKIFELDDTAYVVVSLICIVVCWWVITDFGEEWER